MTGMGDGLTGLAYAPCAHLKLGSQAFFRLKLHDLQFPLLPGIPDYRGFPLIQYTFRFWHNFKVLNGGYKVSEKSLYP
jgi:hypothetical protein